MIATPQEHPHDEAPSLVFVSGADTLQLEPDGKVYRPGDPMPRSLSHVRRIQLQAAGIRFETRHPEPPAAPVNQPAVEQPVIPVAVPVENGDGVEVRAAEPKTDDEQTAPRASRKGN